MSKHSLTAIAEIWTIVSESISDEDRESIAENVVAVLIDHDYSLDDIKYEFENDADIINAVKYYSDDEVWPDEDEDYDVDYDMYDEEDE